MMLFAVLFRLSMDYEVFLLSRIIREECIATGDNTEAVRARPVSDDPRDHAADPRSWPSVLRSLRLSDQRVIAEFGIGLAAAIFIDATVMRFIRPSLMQLAGKWNWWMPHWLDRIVPRLSFEGHPALPPAPAPIAGGSD